jgi:hypothetical protein
MGEEKSSEGDKGDEMSVYIAPKKWPALDDNPSSSEVALNLRRVFNTLNDHDQAINTMYANGTSSTTTTITETTTSTSSSTSSGVTSFNGNTGAVSFFSNLGTVDNQTGVTSYTTQTADNGALLLIDDASPVAITLNFNVSTPWFTTIYNLGTSTATLTPSSGTVNDTTSVNLFGGSFCIVSFDGTNFWAAMIPIATTSQFGLVMPDGVTVDVSSGVISVPTATSSALGIVKPDNTTITVSSGTLTAVTVSEVNGATIPASATVLGSNSSSQLIAASTTGSGTTAVLGTSPTFTTSITSPVVYGGSAAGSTLTLDGTSNGSPSNAYVLLNPSGQGNVGIGTLSPQEALEVISSQTATNVMLLQNTNSNGYSGIDLYNSSSTLGGSLYYANSGAVNPNAVTLASRINGQPLYLSAGGTTPQVTLLSSGNVGIGTTGPQQPLTVTSSANVAQFWTSTSPGFPGAGYADILLGQGSGSYTTGNYTTLAFGRSATTSGSSYIQSFIQNGSWGNAKLLLQPNGGNVGIGTSSPNSTLSVVGLPVYANNAAAISGGLAAGDFYRTGANPDPVCVVH